MPATSKKKAKKLPASHRHQCPGHKGEWFCSDAKCHHRGMMTKLCPECRSVMEAQGITAAKEDIQSIDTSNELPSKPNGTTKKAKRVKTPPPDEPHSSAPQPEEPTNIEPPPEIVALIDQAATHGRQQAKAAVTRLKIEAGEPGPCIRPSCASEANGRFGRGLCMTDYDIAYYLVKEGKAHWEDLEGDGMALPVGSRPQPNRHGQKPQVKISEEERIQRKAWFLGVEPETLTVQQPSQGTTRKEKTVSVVAAPTFDPSAAGVPF